MSLHFLVNTNTLFDVIAGIIALKKLQKGIDLGKKPVTMKHSEDIARIPLNFETMKYTKIVAEVDSEDSTFDGEMESSSPDSD